MLLWGLMMKININKAIDILKENLSDDILDSVKYGSYDKPNISVIELIKSTFEIEEDIVEHQIEIMNIYCTLQDELVMEVHFPRERIKAFKNNPKKYANAKCIDDDSIYICDYLDKYILIKEYEHAKTFIIFYVTDDNQTCLFEENTYEFEIVRDALTLTLEDSTSVFERV